MKNIDLSHFNTDTNNELEKAEERAQKKGGRKPKPQDKLCTERVATSLTVQQKEDWLKALDGRAEATTLRRLIENFITEQNK